MNSENKRSSIFFHPLYLMEFGIDSIMLYCDYVSTVTSPDVPLCFTKTHQKASLMFKERFVSNIEFIDKDDFYEIFAKVKAEMKKNKVYKVSMTISKANEVKSAICECAGGAEPAACKHSLAVLFAVENYSQKELYAAPTEQLQRWHQVKPKKASPVKFGIECQSGRNLKINYSSLKDLPFNAPIFDVLPKSLFNIDEAAYEKSVPLPLIVLGKNFENVYPDSLDDDKILFFKENIALSFEEAANLEKKTIQQSSCDTWKINRIKRITSSSFYEVCKTKCHERMANQLLNQDNDLSYIPAIKYGKDNEPLIQNVIKLKYSKYIFRKTGLVINPNFPHLGASPDGLLHNSDDTLIIEIKCIFNPGNLDLHDLCKTRRDFCLEFVDEQFSLKKKHKYMFQIQGQLGITNLSKCLFVLLYKQNNPLFVQEILFDLSMWMEIKNNVTDFYFKHYMPLLMKD